MNNMNMNGLVEAIAGQLQEQLFGGGGDADHRRIVKPFYETLDDVPEPDTPPDETNLTPIQRKLRKIVRKCTISGSGSYRRFFDKTTLMETVMEDPNGCLTEVGPPPIRIKGIVLQSCTFNPIRSKPFTKAEIIEADENQFFNIAVFTTGRDPWDFHLMWHENTERAIIINNWLTNSEERGELVRLDGLPEAGDKVAILYVTDSFWYRGVVVKITFDARILVKYIDYGNLEIVSTEKLRVLPEVLQNNPPPLSFPCFLAGVRPNLIGFENGNTFDPVTKSEFLQRLSGPDDLKIQRNEFNLEFNSWSVKIWKGPDPYICVNGEALRSLTARQRSARPKADGSGVPPLLMDGRQNIDMRKIEIKEYPKCVEKGLRDYRVSHIISPHDFFLEYVENKEGITSTWRDRLQSLYDNPVLATAYKLGTVFPIIGRCYAYKNPIDQRWERVRALSLDERTRTCQMYFIDKGFQAPANFDDLLELHNEFITWAAMSFRAYLVDLIAPEVTGFWPAPAVQEFRNLVEGKLLSGITVAQEQKPGVDGTNMALGMILIDRSLDGITSQTLNGYVCSQGWATANGVAAGGNDIYAGGMPQFDITKMNLSLLEERAEYEFIDVPSIPRPKSKQTVVAAQAPAPIPGSEPATQQEEAAMLYQVFVSHSTAVHNNKDRIPNEISNKLGLCQVTVINSPGCFYLQMVEKVEELAILGRCLAKVVGDREPMRPSSIKDGIIVAISLSESGKAEGSTWHRALIKQALSSIFLVKVLLIDIGTEASVRYELVRDLPEYFLTLPCYVQRVHLDTRNLIPLGVNKWSTEAGTIFRKYVLTWQAELPVYYTWQPKGAKDVELDTINQDVWYEGQGPDHTWVPGPIRGNMNLKKPNIIANYPILKNLYVSKGIDMVYEIFSPEKEGYHFERIWDVLINNGMAKLINEVKHHKDENNQKKFHVFN